MLVSVNDFVRRQIKGSGKTYSTTMTFEEIALHASVQMEKGRFKDGYREGVRIVQMAKQKTEHFFCPYVRVSDEIELEAKVVRRRKNENTYIYRRQR